MRYRFGNYELNTQTRELSQAGLPIPLTPKAYAVLAYLLAHHERLVSKEELLEQVWPDTYVDDSAVKRNIMAVRRAIGGAGGAEHIKTQRGQGYRFTTSVHVLAPDATPAADAPIPLPDSPTPASVCSPDRSNTGERKLITALYCTVRGALVSDGEMDLDALNGQMQMVYSVAQEEAQHYGGTIQYTTSEGCLILFGVPVAQEDHARRAVLTAWDIQRRLHRQQQPLQPQISLHTGLVVVSRLPEQPHDMATVVGDVTTLATAMSRQAPQDTILASATTAQLLQDSIRTSPMAPLSIDHTARELPVYRVTEVAPQKVDNAHLPSPFVGREVELTMLRTRWELVQEGRGQVVSIVGEPGIGKSRLLREFRTTLPWTNVAHRRLDGRSYGRATPYLPILDLLRATWAIVDTDTDDTIAVKVEAGLCEAGLEARLLGPYFRSLLGQYDISETASGLSSDVLRTRIFDALHQFFLYGNGTAPTIIEVENAHWLDATSGAYVTALADRLAGAPVLLLLTFRPGYRPRWLDKSYVTQIALPSLGATESRQILSAILGSDALDAAGQALMAKAEGNPFFLEELARTVAERGHTAPIRSIPNTIHAVLAARIDRLAPAEKQLLQAASVIGPEVPIGMLAVISDLPEADLQQHLRQLQVGEFFYEDRLLPEPVYVFKHALIHEVAYGNLLQSQRQHLHSRIVEAVEHLAGMDLAADTIDVLARHALGAALWDKVCDYFSRAGVHAMARSAYREAVASFEQALEGLDHLPEAPRRREQAVDLRLRLHNALLRTGDPVRSLTLLEEAQPIAEALDDANRLGWIASYLSTHHLMAGDTDGALSYGQRAQALADVCEDSHLQVDVRLHLGQAYHARGDYPAAISVLAPNVEFLNPLLHRNETDLASVPGLHTLPWMILCLAETGDFARGERYIEEAQRIAAMGERPYEQVVVDGSSGLLRLRQGEVAAAIPLLERALSRCRAADIRHMLPIVASYLGGAYLQSGRLSEATLLLEDAIAQAADMRMMAHHALSLVILGQAYRLAGRTSDAKAQAERAISLSQTHKEYGNGAWAYHLLGEALTADTPAEVEAAEVAFRQALAQAETYGMQPLQAHCHLGLGALYHRRYEPSGQASQAQAEAELAAARALYRSLDMPFWLSRVEDI